MQRFVIPAIVIGFCGATASAAFSGAFALVKWTFVNNPPTTGGSGVLTVDEMTVTGGDAGVSGDSEWRITSSASALVTFDFSWKSLNSTAGFDSAYYSVNAVKTILPDTDEQFLAAGSAGPIALQPGDQFALGVCTADGIFGPGILKVTNFTAAVPSRASTSQKGSLLIFPKVEVTYATPGDPDSLTRDTFIQISNDLNDLAGVHVVGFFVGVGDDGQCIHRYGDFDLTHDQPAYFRASTGAPLGFGPAGPGATNFRGYFVCFATNPSNHQIRFNHLTGLATVTDYAARDAYEYSPYAFQALSGESGSVVGAPGVLRLDGVEYETGFNRLNLEFIPVGSMEYSGAGVTLTHDTEVALLINDIDARQENEDYCTKAVFEIWDNEEHSFKAEYCFCCWDCSALSVLGVQFSSAFLNGHDPARARIDGVSASDAVCGFPPGPGFPQAGGHALLGVAVKVLHAGAASTRAASHLVGQGNQSAVIYYDPASVPEEGGGGTGRGVTLQTLSGQ